MNDLRKGGLPRLEFDLDGFTKAERLVTYEMGNTLLMLNLELQNKLGLRAEDYQIFLLIALQTTQRFARSASTDSPHICRAPLPDDHAGTISRRRISEVLGIPLETVRRTVSRFLETGLIVERTRGGLSTPGGTLERMSDDMTPEKIIRRFVGSINAMIRLGAIDVLPKE